MTTFIELGLSKPITATLTECGYTEPTEIQTRAIPVILSGKDIMASAQTGSGKTAAFALPIIELLAHTSKKPRALILVPTRELALQVHEQVMRYASHAKLRSVTVYGGTGYHKQTRELQRGVDVIVATPGRLLDHVESGVVNLATIEVLILDEADRMLDMGFMPQVRKIVSRLPKERQTLMFSATIDRRVEQIAAQYLKSPVTIRVNVGQVEPKDIDQRLYHVKEFGKDALLLQLIQETDMNTVLVFTRTRRKAAWVKSRLCAANIKAEEIHGDISQSERERTLTRYREGKFNVLVATDVAARGLDIPSISHVVNYDLPDTPQDYVHRIGRTGRAGRSGVALSFVSEEQRYLIRDIERVTGKQLDPNAPASKTKSEPAKRWLFRSSRKRRA